MSALERLPEWATTGVGSLPHTDVEDGRGPRRRRLRRPVLPAAAAAGRRHDHRVARIRSEPLRVVARARPRAAAGVERVPLGARPRAAAARRREAAGDRAGHPGATRSETPRSHDEIAVWLAANVAAQVRALDGFDVLLMVDEPALHLFEPRRLGPAARGRAAVGPASLRPGAVGRRGARGARRAVVRSVARSPRRGVLAHLVARGGRIAWGVVQPHRPEHGLHALQRLSARHDDGAWSLLTPAVRDRADVAPARARDRHRVVGHGLRAAARQRDEVAARTARRVAERARRRRAELQAVAGAEVVHRVAFAKAQPALQHPDLLVDERVGLGRIGHLSARRAARPRPAPAGHHARPRGACSRCPDRSTSAGQPRGRAASLLGARDELRQRHARARPTAARAAPRSAAPRRARSSRSSPARRPSARRARSPRGLAPCARPAPPPRATS